MLVGGTARGLAAGEFANCTRGRGNIAVLTFCKPLLALAACYPAPIVFRWQRQLLALFASVAWPHATHTLENNAWLYVYRCTRPARSCSCVMHASQLAARRTRREALYVFVVTPSRRHGGSKAFDIDMLLPCPTTPLPLYCYRYKLQASPRWRCALLPYYNLACACPAACRFPSSEASGSWLAWLLGPGCLVLRDCERAHVDDC
jgi:hypothetical protein